MAIVRRVYMHQLLHYTGCCHSIKPAFLFMSESINTNLMFHRQGTHCHTLGSLIHNKNFKWVYLQCKFRVHGKKWVSGRGRSRRPVTQQLFFAGKAKTFSVLVVFLSSRINKSVPAYWWMRLRRFLFHELLRSEHMRNSFKNVSIHTQTSASP